MEITWVRSPIASRPPLSRRGERPGRPSAVCRVQKASPVPYAGRPSDGGFPIRDLRSYCCRLGLGGLTLGRAAEQAGMLLLFCFFYAWTHKGHAHFSEKGLRSLRSSHPGGIMPGFAGVGDSCAPQAGYSNDRLARMVVGKGPRFWSRLGGVIWELAAFRSSRHEHESKCAFLA